MGGSSRKERVCGCHWERRFRRRLSRLYERVLRIPRRPLRGRPCVVYGARKGKEHWTPCSLCSRGLRDRNDGREPAPGLQYHDRSFDRIDLQVHDRLRCGSNRRKYRRTGRSLRNPLCAGPTTSVPRGQSLEKVHPIRFVSKDWRIIAKAAVIFYKLIAQPSFFCKNERTGCSSMDDWRDDGRRPLEN